MFAVYIASVISVPLTFNGLKSKNRNTVLLKHMPYERIYLLQMQNSDTL